MVGSVKYFVYTDDFGDDFAIKLDESNTEAVNGAIQDFPAVPPTINEVPRNVKPRYAIYQNPERTITRRVVLLTQAIFAGVPAGAASVNFGVPAGTLTLFRIVGEERRYPVGADTGQTDGDDT
jgi:hypothetical protein